MYIEDKQFSQGFTAMSSLAALPQTITNSWLAMQCQMIPGVVCAAVFSLENSDSEFPVPTASWPPGEDAATAGLRVAAARAMAQNKPVVCCEPQPSAAEKAPQLNIACPILIDGLMQGVIVVEINATDEQRQRAVLQMLSWGSMWLQFALQQDAGTGNELPGKVLQVVAASLEHSHFQAAATACASELASSLQCERVSLGFTGRNALRLRAISNSANFDSQTNLARALELAMTEALEQQATIACPSRDASASGQILSAHTRLCQQHRSGSVCTVPLSAEGSLIGAISFERLTEQAFDDESIQYFEAIAALLGPILELKRRQERHPVSQMWDAGAGFVGRLFGPSHSVLKLSTSLLTAAIIGLSLVQGDYRTSGDAVLEGSIQRVVVAPMDGFIKTASVRPGDIVNKGQVLGSLDDQDLRLERLGWSGQQAQLQKEYREALGKHERAQIGILSAQIEQADAQLDLIDEQLARTEFIAPFDGVVVSGDLDQQLGAPVERGRVLFTVAPLNSYRVAVKIDEQEIFELAEGQSGQLVLSAQPDELLPITVTKITPVSTAQDGRNFFRVEANLLGTPDQLRPGMQGVAKIDIEQRKLIWIWTHTLANWLRMRTWSWLG
jgi:multidrug efflux pump subunit AcrA (membrane-fusion protein)